jgi:hypothetical protein
VPKEWRIIHLGYIKHKEGGGGGNKSYIKEINFKGRDPWEVLVVSILAIIILNTEVREQVNESQI